MRGTYPDQLDEDLAHEVGGAFVRVVGAAARDGGPGAVVIAHDMRPSGPSLVAAFADGVREQGCDVVLIGLASTDGLYFASGSLGLPGAMFTASHNPAQYNGIKLCRPGASPVGQDSGLREITAHDQRGRAGLRRADGRGERARPARRLRGLPARPGRRLRHPPPARSWSTPATAWAGSPCRPCSATLPDCRPCPSTSTRCTSSSTAPSRTTRRTRSTTRTCATCRRACARRAPTSDSRSTATPTAASWSTSAARSSTPRR